MTTGSEAITRLKFRLSRNTSASSPFEAQILGELNAAQERLERGELLPHFLITERAENTLTIGEERVPVPGGFLREKDQDDMQIQDTSETDTSKIWTELRKTNMDQLRRRYPDEQTGRPQGYTLQGGYFRLRPIPDKEYILWMVFYKADDPITDSATANKWLTYYPDLVISEAGIVLATALKNQSALQLFTNMQVAERDRFIRNETARIEENFDPNPED